MARIKFSGLVTEIRGSIGGTTFQRNAYGFTVKNKSSMTLPLTVTQLQRQNLYSRATKDWGQLTEVQRETWRTWASTFPQFAANNPDSQLSGFAVFVKHHLLAKLNAGSPLVVLPAPSFEKPALDLLQFRLVRSADTLRLIVTSSDESDQWRVNLFLSRPFAQAQNFIGTATRFIIGLSNAMFDENIAPDYSAVFGSLPTVGQVINLRMQQTGFFFPQVPAPQYYRLTVADS